MGKRKPNTTNNCLEDKITPNLIISSNSHFKLGSDKGFDLGSKSWMEMKSLSTSAHEE